MVFDKYELENMNSSIVDNIWFEHKQYNSVVISIAVVFRLLIELGNDVHVSEKTEISIISLDFFVISFFSFLFILIFFSFINF